MKITESQTQGFISCSAILAVTLVPLVVLFQFAKLPEKTITWSQQPLPIENFDLVIDMGEDYGTASIIELMGNYIENPPIIVKGLNNTDTKREFGGC
ncbi:MAG: hypothetical protein VCA13_08075 [PS1 clade bacterium]|jgi:hypothetical protein|tara:strand:- start:747 stop:1037 length:291 start_codon:yes stop_codon:yes gene_type:complete